MGELSVVHLRGNRPPGELLQAHSEPVRIVKNDRVVDGQVKRRGGRYGRSQRALNLRWLHPADFLTAAGLHSRPPQMPATDAPPLSYAERVCLLVPPPIGAAPGAVRTFFTVNRVGGPPPGAGGGRGTRRCWAAAWPVASSAVAHRRGPLPQRGQPRTRPLPVTAVTHPSVRACQSCRAVLLAPGILSPEQDHSKGRCGLRKPQMERERHGEHCGLAIQDPHKKPTTERRSRQQRLAGSSCRAQRSCQAVTSAC